MHLLSHSKQSRIADQKDKDLSIIAVTEGGSTIHELAEATS
jgi:hypothetical protein